MTAALVAGCALVGLLAGSALGWFADGFPARPAEGAVAGRRRRVVAVALSTAALAAVFGWREGATATLPAHLALVVVAVPLAAVDLRTHRLPDALVLPAYPVLAALLVGATVVDGDRTALSRAAAGGLVAFGVYYALAVAARGALGFGDVKLAGVLGTVLGAAGWASLCAGGFLGFAYGGATSLVLLAVGRVTRRTRVPFGPFMLAGALTVLLVGDPAVAAGLGLPTG